MDNLGFSKDSDGNPTIEDCQSQNFGRYYISPEGQTLFRALYDNNQGIQDKFVGFWAEVAKKFASNQYIMGFDVLNEPYIAINNLL